MREQGLVDGWALGVQADCREGSDWFATPRDSLTQRLNKDKRHEEGDLKHLEYCPNGINS